jgi:hypothetical protein
MMPQGGSMSVLRLLALILSVCMAAPSFAQTASEPGVLDRIRGFFNRIFADDPKPADEPERPAAPAPAAPAPAAPAAAPVETRPAPPPDRAESQAQPVKPTASAQPASRSLHEYIAKGDYGTALKMMEQGADVEARDPGAGASVLHYAVMRGRMPIIDLLLSRGADVNSRTKMGTTPLHTAVLYARLEVAELLLDAGADIHAQSASGATPLAIAEAARNQPLAVMLRGRGAK